MTSNVIHYFNLKTNGANMPLAEDERVHPLSSALMQSKVGFHELFSLKISIYWELIFTLVWIASQAELVGTAVLVFTIDTIVISSYETKTTIPKFITVEILLHATNPISGGHINPVVTLSRHFQCAGAVLGVLALKVVVNNSIEGTFSLGGCTLAVIAPGPNGPIIMDIETTQGLRLEIICTCSLLIVGIVVGLLVQLPLQSQRGICRSCMYPNGHWVIWVGPIIACMVFYLYIKIISRQHFHPGGYKHDSLNIVKTLPKEMGCIQMSRSSSPRSSSLT
ncbi:unnamed protein product [Malus baccata var. baccata]